MAKKILVVDDEPFILRSVSFILQKEGYEVFCASNGVEALDIAWDKKPDLIILDLMMPVMDGIETLSLIRKKPQLKDIPVIMLTAVAVESSVKEVLRLGVDDYILKPYDSQKLIQKVKSVLKRSSKGEFTEEDSIKKVLVADSKPSVIQSARTALEQNYRVIEAVNGPQAISKAIEEKPALMMVDLSLPLMDGFEVAKKLRKINELKGMKIYALCPLSISSNEHNKAREAGFDGFIPKPFDPSDLVVLVSKILGGSHFPTTEKDGVLIINLSDSESLSLSDLLKKEISRRVEQGKDKIILKFEKLTCIGIQQVEDIVSILNYANSLKVSLKFVIPSEEAVARFKGFYELQNLKIYSDEDEAIREFNK